MFAALPTVRDPFAWDGVAGVRLPLAAAEQRLRQLLPYSLQPRAGRTRLAPDASPAQARFADSLAWAIATGQAGIACQAVRQQACYSFSATGQPTLCYLAPQRIPAALRSLAGIRLQLPQLSPLLLAIGAFAHFIAIHPFYDGNGRCARHLLSCLLRQHGLCGPRPLPLAYLLYRDRARHLACLQAWLLYGDASAFLPYALEWILAAAELQLLVEQS
ncbi:Fic family protein [Massilia sp. TS11]|uniref:Fic family protein n=1 Tax=Massilia sp. TS11 TaxID=2908003 RepID=UPI001EDA5F99|nr:Fic family protein [Massilia sp. TS11]MCG2583423.1 Fic family protein [Massilia sp. TS11]